MRSFKVEVKLRDEPRWHGNGVRLDTEEHAAMYGADLMGRWLLVVEYRVVESEDPPNLTFANGKMVDIV